MLVSEALKVSIITPTLNSARYLEKTIVSIINQTYHNIEHIIIDGQSTDKTLDIVKTYKNNINIVLSEPDEGIYDAFNKGIGLATGDILYFLNSDDYLYNEKVIENVANAFLVNPFVSMVYGNVVFFDPRYEFENIIGRPVTLNDLKNGEMLPHHQAMFVRKELFNHLGVFETIYPIVGDFEFLIRCFKSNIQSLYINKNISVFRLTGSGSDPRNMGVLNKAKIEVMKKHFGETKYSNGSEFQALYRIWLERLLLKGEGISKKLCAHNVKKVAIWGTMKTGMYLFSDLKKEGFEIVAFLDNNPNMQGKKINAISVYPPEAIRDNSLDIDAIVLSVESPSRELQLMDQLNNLIIGRNIYVTTWKNLVSECFNEG
jgi:glycosyltransferase involved in cell wall biosynthesis